MKFSGIRCVLLDIEGTTSSIAFVYDVMFKYAREHLRAFLEERIDEEDVQSAVLQMRQDLNDPAWCSPKLDRSHRIDLIERCVREWMDADRKATGLKTLQGLIWQDGFASGQLRSHLFPDVVTALRRWKDLGLSLRIYSSGSIRAQQLFFGHTESGNLLELFEAHYDTTTGNKREKESYLRIAGEASLEPNQILFVSDLPAELDAASLAGMQVVASCRPGNAPLPMDSITRKSTLSMSSS